MDIRELSAETGYEAAIPLLRQLWTDADPGAVREWITEEEYHLFGGRVADELVGVAGALVTGHLHHVRHAWLYDLVVDEAHRGEGHGTRLVEHVEAWAEREGCDRLALASPLEKTDVHSFYERQGYETWGYVIERSL